MPGGALARHRRGELALGEDGQGDLRVLRPGGEGPGGDPRLARPGHLPAVEVQSGGDAPLLKHPLHVPAPGLVAAQQQSGVPGAQVVLQVPGGGLHAAAVGAELLGPHRQQRPGGQGVPGGGQGVHHAQGEAPQRLQPLALAQQQPRQVPVLLPGGQQALRVLPGLPEHGLHPLRQPSRLPKAHQGVRGEVVEAGGQIRPGQQLQSGQQQSLLQVCRPPLGGGVELPQGVDLVVEELAADGLVHHGGEHVQDAPPEGELPHALHLVAPGVPGGHQAAGQGGEVQPLPHRQAEGRRPQLLRRRGLLQQALAGGHHHPAPALGEGVEGGDPPVLPLAGDDGARLDKELPGEELQRLLSRQIPQVLPQAARLPLVGTDHHQGPSGLQGQGRRRLGAVDGTQPGDGGGALPPLHRPDQGRHLRDRQQHPQQLFHCHISASSPESSGYIDRALR